ncbi:MAG TPA: hypothetical protein VNX68_00080 [Nitrosopumilaceae archaeon]|nr:hypothetical protein [Nitrosopumilaceae archaeon]
MNTKIKNQESPGHASSKENHYLQTLFDARLEKEHKKTCPKCNNPVKENYRLMSGTKEFYCIICLNKVSPLVATFFGGTHIPIASWLDVYVKVHDGERVKREVMAKEIVMDLNHSLKTSYRMLSKIQDWKKEHKIPGTKNKRTFKFKNRTGADALFKLILENMPPLFSHIYKKPAVLIEKVGSY